MQAHHHYTDEEKSWLIAQDKTLTYGELTALFNQRFGTNLKKGQISDLMIKRLKSRREGNKGQFRIGAKPKYKVGDEIIKFGYVYVKISDEYIPGRTTTEDYYRKWKLKSRLVWEKEHGEIPKGKIIVYLDGNPLNCNIENLYLTSRSVHAMMSKNSWYKLDREFTLATLKYCELYQLKKSALMPET